MRSLHSFLIVLLTSLIWTNPAHAFDSTTQGLVKTGYATSQVSSSPFDNKLVMAARDDAAVFVATEGQIRGARLESALRILRQSHVKLRASDLELAQAILVQ
ncbi:Holliday junction resolvase [Pseudomonas floridensis]|uniref:Holliday junction resolvase n=1 Tax=Pseudomonas floridensis TaxID=1958950 RepID=A0A1X0N685_9PSED|nr:DUF2388 domain-containing protein [Pseudomonas floridensis]ORC58977.1 Holliday junction resolvase [Pseudomonas floridensis]